MGPLPDSWLAARMAYEMSVILHGPISTYDYHILTLLLLNRTCPVLANSVDPELASEEANGPGSALFVIKYVNFYQIPISSNLIGWKLKVGGAF